MDEKKKEGVSQNQHYKRKKESTVERRQRRLRAEARTFHRLLCASQAAAMHHNRSSKLVQCVSVLLQYGSQPQQSAPERARRPPTPPPPPLRAASASAKPAVVPLPSHNSEIVTTCTSVPVSTPPIVFVTSSAATTAACTGSASTQSPPVPAVLGVLAASSLSQKPSVALAPFRRTMAPAPPQRGVAALVPGVCGLRADVPAFVPCNAEGMTVGPVDGGGTARAVPVSVRGSGVPLLSEPTAGQSVSAHCREGFGQQPLQSRAAPSEADGGRSCIGEVGTNCVIQSSVATPAVSIDSAHSSTVTASSAPTLSSVSQRTVNGELRALCDAAELHLVGGRLDGARLMFTQALQALKHPSVQQLNSTAQIKWRENTLATLHVNLARVFSRESRWLDALDHANLALRVQPRHAQALRWRQVAEEHLRAQASPPGDTRYPLYATGPPCRHPMPVSVVDRSPPLR